MTLDVATFSQIMTLLTQLSTNYTNIFTDYYNVFYNPEPMDITLQFYDQDGNLEEITIPNRAKDRTYILNGNGGPNGNISGNRGSIYQDLANGEVYINIDGSINGWTKLFSEAALSKILIQGSGSPEDVVSAEKGVLYIDVQNTALYIKSTDTGDTGWVLVSASTSVLARVSLDNLNEEGEAHFVNPSLSNINEEGILKFTVKEDKDNKVSEITSTSESYKYPTVQAVYNFVTSTANMLANRDLSNLTSEGQALINNKANIDLSNLSTTGQSKFDNKANIDLSNLTTTGMSKIQPIGQPQLTLDFGILPANCIWLEGAEVSRTTYANLFAIYGTTYGEGDGSTTFTLPDFRNRTLWGGTYGGYIEAGLPNITGTISLQNQSFGTAVFNGAFSSTSWSRTNNSGDGGTGSGLRKVAFKASSSNPSNPIYGDSDTVQPPSIKVRVYTRYQ
jgi:hypothetical protein